MTKTDFMTASVGKDGRVVLPVKLRRKLKLTPGMKLNVSLKHDGILLADPMIAWKALQDYFKPFRPKPGEKLLSEQLIDERRAEAIREEME